MRGVATAGYGPGIGITADTTTPEAQELRPTSVAQPRFRLLMTFLVALVFAEWLFWLGSAHERTPWWVAAVFPIFSLGAAIQCFRTAATISGSQHKAWRFFGLGCLSLCAGEMMWGIFDVVHGETVPFSIPMDMFYFGFPISFIVGIWYYRTRTLSTDDGVIQLGNLGIILAATLLMYIFAYADFLRAEELTYFAASTVAYAILDLSGPIFALAVLSLHTWGRRRRIMLLIFSGLCFNASSDFSYISDLLGSGYRASSLLSGMTPLCLSIIAWAAFEQRQLEHANDEGSTHSETWVKKWESLLPPLAVSGVLVVALLYRDRLVADLTPYVVVASLLFIASLAVRNWWGITLENRLRGKAKLSQSGLEATNRELAMQNLALRRTQNDLEVSQARLAAQQEQLEVLVTERTRELEQSRQALHRADRLASLGTLAAGIAHEINNPLGMIRLQADEALLVRDENIYRNALQGTLDQVRRCSEIVRGILRFSREEASPKQGVDLAEIAQRSVKLARHYASRANVETECQIACELGSDDAGSATVVGNATELEQVIINLLRNAVEASDKGARVYLNLCRMEGLLRLDIVDEGAGMTDETREHAFDPFYTTRRDEGAPAWG